MALKLIGASGGAVCAGNSDRSDMQRAYMTWDTMRVPGTWKSDKVSVTPPPGWYRFRLWVSENLIVSPNGVGLPGDVSLATTGMAAPAIDTICQVADVVNVRYRADRPCEYRMELTPI